MTVAVEGGVAPVQLAQRRAHPPAPQLAASPRELVETARERLTEADVQLQQVLPQL